MKEYLENNASEVENTLLTEFNMDDAKRVWQEEAREEGLEKTAKAALAKGLSVSDVADITGLGEEKVKKLKTGVVM